MSNTKRKDVGYGREGEGEGKRARETTYAGKEGIVTFRDKGGEREGGGKEGGGGERVAVGEIFLAATTMQQLSPSVIYERPTGATRRGPRPLRGSRDASHRSFYLSVFLFFFSSNSKGRRKQS